MTHLFTAFSIKKGDKVLDYRVGGEMNLDEIKVFLEKRGYRIDSILPPGRHVICFGTKDGQDIVIKVAASEGISVVTENEYRWNEAFNQQNNQARFVVPKNIDHGYIDPLHFFLVTERLDGELTLDGPKPFSQLPFDTEILDAIISFAEYIQSLSLSIPTIDEEDDYRQKFFNKSTQWFEAIPAEIRREYNVQDLLSFVENGLDFLEEKPRHGDFTPWHLIKLKDNSLGRPNGTFVLFF